MRVNKRRWGLSAVVAAVLLLLIAALYFYQRYQQRHVQAPQQLLALLEAVALDEAALDAALLHSETLTDQHRLWLGEQLLADLERSDHPDPAAAVEALLPSASEHLVDAEGLAAALTRRLQALPAPPWERRISDSRQWRVAAGDWCLGLEFQPEQSGVLWRWTDFSRCPPASD